MKQVEFLTILMSHFKRFKRAMPWRIPEPNGTFDPYKILISELMLQQTQVNRVIPKFETFLDQFPTIKKLAAAPLPDVLKAWVGLGYNRRAKYLWQTAKQLNNAAQPWTYEDLIACPGIGPNTAQAIMAYAYNQPVLFLETNIRSVLIFHFFKGRNGISEKELTKVLEAVVPWNNSKFTFEPREFYWAMMDYGTHLKAQHGNLSKQSKSYIKQSVFKGSRRQIRGHIIRLLTQGPMGKSVVAQHINDQRVNEVCEELEREGLILLQGNTLMLYNEGISDN